jgi:hypothetical protein
MSFGYVHNSLSPQFRPAGTPGFKSENAFEFNALFLMRGLILLQPVIQYYGNVGGRPGRAVVFGFRTKVEL